jgi:hypothetical protein
LCVSPRSHGEDGGAQTTVGDDELIEEEAVGEEVLGPEAIAIGSGLKLVLDEDEVTAERIPSSNSDGEGQHWPAMVSRGMREGMKVEEEELLLCPRVRIGSHAHGGQHSPAATGTGATTVWWAWSPAVSSQTVCAGGTE